MSIDKKAEVLNEQLDVMDALADGSFDLKLATVRAQNPYASIFKFPDSVINVVLVANVAQDVNIPQGAKLVRFAGKGDYFVTRNGNAAVPTVSTSGDTYGTGALYKPEYCFFTADEMRNISLVSDSDAIVTVHCYYGN